MPALTRTLSLIGTIGILCIRPSEQLQRPAHAALRFTAWKGPKCAGGASHGVCAREVQYGPRAARTELRMSSMIAPPNTPTKRKRLGGGGSDDGLRKLTVDEYTNTLEQWLKDWKRRNDGRVRIGAEMHPDLKLIHQMMEQKMELSDNGRTPKFALGLFNNGRVTSVAVVELLRRNMPWTLSISVMHSNPKFGKRVSATMLGELKTMAEENSLLLDLTPLEAIPSLASLAREDAYRVAPPPTMSDDPKVNEYRKVIAKFPSLVLDGLPEDADLGPYWYSATLPDGVDFYFKRRSRRHNEFFVSVDNPEDEKEKGGGRAPSRSARSPREIGASHGAFPVIVAEDVHTLHNFHVPGKKFVTPVMRSISRKLHQLKASGGSNNGPSRGRGGSRRSR